MMRWNCIILVFWSFGRGYGPRLDTITRKKSRVTKKEPKIPATKGNNNEPSSFGKFYGNDSGAAAYLSISDVGDFKKYRFSYLILEYALCFGRTLQAKQRRAL